MADIHSHKAFLCLASTDKQKGVPVKQNTAVNSSSRNHSATGEERTLGKSNSIKIKGENGKNARDPRLSKREESIAKIGKKKYQKINLDEAEEFFELISKAQSNRADDQHGLLRKEDLVLPEFLRLPPGSTELTLPTPAAVAKDFSKRSATDNGWESASQPGEQWEPAPESSDSPSTSPGSALSPPGPPGMTPPGQKSPSGPFCTPHSPVSPAQEGTAQIWKRQSQEGEAGGIQMVEDEHVAELTLMGEGDISSPNSTLLLPPSTPQDVPGPSRPGSGTHGSRGLPVNRIIDVDLVTGSAPGRDGGIAGARAGPGRSQASGGPPTSDLPGLGPVPGEPAKPKTSAHHATFV
ncbi:regulator of G-protein signaling 12-like [Gorilla gorilla gorilla]|uniref:regulator of G-protein signaling 12-like n=1 Tax=Gorilla gorilla gorilla TaxID=9595 RepID=UPI002445BF64|nr:regulator of G-protein signaling 12-like [Gorilla gorilla gorilla]